VVVITMMVALYGAFDEIHQLFVPGREASMGDLVADVVGGLVAAVLFRKGRMGRIMIKGDLSEHFGHVKK
jgi:VanZ family protein